MIFSDGSGQGWQTSAGWGVYCIDLLSGERVARYGGLDAGSVNLAELMPIVQAMILYHEAGRGQKVIAERGYCRVVALTDSGYVAMTSVDALDPNKPLPDKHSGLWAVLRQYTRLGYLIRIYHKNRSTTLANQFCDVVASEARKAVIAAVVDNLDVVKTKCVDPLDLRGLHP